MLVHRILRFLLQFGKGFPSLMLPEKKHVSKAYVNQRYITWGRILVSKTLVGLEGCSGFGVRHRATWMRG